MKSRGTVVGALLWAITLAVHAVPSLIQYQGQVAVNGTPFDGNGTFTFALVNEAGDTTHWTSNAVNLPVTNGTFSVILGEDTDPLDASVFDDESDVFLRVWFDDGEHGNEQLIPDQRIAAVAYAVTAARAAVADAVADGAITTDMLSNASITGAKIADDSVNGAKIADGSIAAADIDPNFLPNSTLATSVNDLQAQVTSLEGTVGTPASANTANAIVVRDANGDFGASNITLSGGIQVGNIGVAAAPGNAGAVRFTGTAFEGSDGTNWVPLSGSAGGAAVLSAATPGAELPASPLNPSAVAWWKGEGNPNDELGNVNGSGSVNYGQGLVGQAFDFQGGGFVDMGNPSAVQLNQGTIECWVKKTNFPGGWQDFVDKGGAFLFGCYNGNLAFRNYQNGQIVQSPIDYNDFQDGEWHHVAFTFLSGSSAKIYFDGAEVLSSTMSIPSQGSSLRIGEGAAALIDELAIYSEVLTGTDIGEIYAAGSEGKSNTAGSGYSGPVADLSVDISVSGDRPVRVALQPGDPNVSSWAGSLSGSGLGEVVLKRNGTSIGTFALGSYPNVLSPGSIAMIDTGVVGNGAQTYTYTVEAASGNAPGVGLSNVRLIALEQ